MAIDNILSSSSIPNFLPILNGPLFTGTAIDEGPINAVKVGEDIQIFCEDNQFSLSDVWKKLHELFERESYWTAGAGAQGGISEAFAKRLHEFVTTDQCKFPLYILSMRVSVSGNSC